MGNNRSIEKVIYITLLIISLLLVSIIISDVVVSKLHVGYKISIGIIFAVYSLICGGTISKILTLKK